MKNYIQLIKQKKWSLLFHILTIAIAATVTYISFSSKNTQTLNTSQGSAAVLAAQSEEIDIEETAPEDLKTLSILLLGYGGFGHEGGTLADVIQITHIDFEKSQIAFISIPRDLWVKESSGKESKINSTITLSALNKNLDNDKLEKNATETKDLISNITGISVNYYMAIEFVSFQRAIGEELGGIDVQVEETLNDSWYPVKGLELETCGLTAEEVADLTNQYSGFELEKQFPCRYEHLLYKKGLVHMEGGDALKFVRSRHGSAGGDFSRSKRQQAVLVGIKNKLFSIDALDDAPGFFKEMNDHLHTDINLEIVKYLRPALKNTKDYEIINIGLDTNNTLQTSKSNSGQFILIPKKGIHNWQEVQTYINQQLN